MAKDKLGNVIKPGDWVQLELEKPYVIGKVIHTTEGGVLAVGGSRKGQEILTAGAIIVETNAQAIVDPHTGQSNGIVKLVVPGGAEESKIIPN